MKVALVYLHVVAKACPLAPPPSFYEEFSVRFAWTYKHIEHGYDHELIVVSCGGSMDPIGHEIFDQFNPRYMEYRGSGWDLGAYQFITSQLDHDFVMHIATPIKLIRNGWLRAMVEAREKFGDGMYSPQASYQYRPHLRTGMFACSPEMMRKYPYVIHSRQSAVYFECGGDIYPQACFSDWMLSQGKVALMVARDGIYEKQDWRKPDNIFRRGDQSNCWNWDRHNTIYQDSVPSEKIRLEREADGL